MTAGQQEELQKLSGLLEDLDDEGETTKQASVSAQLKLSAKIFY